ncbi:hypothetical protein L873DRAFT_1676085, partial [Choiromyces venosus 120613-1]
TFKEWSKTLFSDETYFTTIGFNYCLMVIHNSDEEFYSNYIDDHEKSTRSGTIGWRAFCGQMKSILVFVPSKISIDSVAYTKCILNQHLISFWHATCEEYGWTKVVEDGSLSDKKYAIKCREKNMVDKIID